MHEYYRKYIEKFRKGMNKYLSPVSSELEKAAGKKYYIYAVSVQFGLRDVRRTRRAAVPGTHLL